MRLGSYSDGRDLNYDETTGAFDVGGTAVTLERVLEYDAAEQVVWDRADLREWTLALSAEPAEEQLTVRPRVTWLQVLIGLTCLWTGYGVVFMIGEALGYTGHFPTGAGGVAETLLVYALNPLTITVVILAVRSRSRVKCPKCGKTRVAAVPCRKCGMAPVVRASVHSHFVPIAIVGLLIGALVAVPVIPRTRQAETVAYVRGIAASMHDENAALDELDSVIKASDSPPTKAERVKVVRQQMQTVYSGLNTMWRPYRFIEAHQRTLDWYQSKMALAESLEKYYWSGLDADQRAASALSAESDAAAKRMQDAADRASQSP